MHIIDLETIAAAHAGLLDVAAEHEEMRCDLELLSATLVDDAIAAGLGTR